MRGGLCFMRHRPRHPLASYPLCSDISSLLQDTWTSALSQPQVRVRVLRDSRRAQEQGKPAAEMHGCGSRAQDWPSSHDNDQRCWLCLEGVSFPIAGLHLCWKLKSSFSSMDYQAGATYPYIWILGILFALFRGNTLDTWMISL